MMIILLTLSIICNLVLIILYYFKNKTLDRVVDKFIKMNQDWGNYCRDMNHRWAKTCSKIQEGKDHDDIISTDKF